MKTLKNLVLCAALAAFVGSGFATETDQPKDKSECKEKAAACAAAKEKCDAAKAASCGAKKGAGCKQAKAEKAEKKCQENNQPAPSQ